MSTESIINEHFTREVGKDDEGWWFMECACGWRVGALPDLDIAVDSYGDHRAEIERLDRAEGRQ